MAFDRRQIRIGFAEGSLQQRYQRTLAREAALQGAVRDLLAFYDRGSGEGWNAAEIQRLDEIRALAAK